MIEEHVQSGMGLTGDAFVHLYEFHLIAAPNQPWVYFTDGPTRVWQGKTYEEAPIRMSGFTRSSDEERSRPSLQVTDPASLLLEFAFNDMLDGARVTRRRLLRAHVEANINLHETHVWYVARVKEAITGQLISLEMRSLSDGPLQLIPARKYIPPEFPFVTL